jgi:hypothetical protein
MRYPSVPLLALASVVCLTPPAAIAQNNQKNTPHSGDVIQSIPPPISQKTTPPPLSLSDDQRAKIKQVLQGHNTQVTFALKSTQSAKTFNPTVGASLPSNLKTYALPPPLIYEMPKLERYTYLKFKGQVLIVNPMTSKIVDMFPAT